MEGSFLKRSTQSVPPEDVQILSNEEVDYLNNEERIQKEHQAAQDTRERFRTFTGNIDLGKIEPNSKPKEQLLGLDIRDSITDIMWAMKNGEDLDEIIRNVTVRPDFDWKDEEELRAIFAQDLKYSFMEEDKKMAKEIFEKLFTAGKIVRKEMDDKRTPGNSQARWIGEGNPWEK